MGNKTKGKQTFRLSYFEKPAKSVIKNIDFSDIIKNKQKVNMKTFIITIVHLFSVFYTFMYWGVGWGIVSLFIPLPFSIIYDIVAKIGQF